MNQNSIVHGANIEQRGCAIYVVADTEKEGSLAEMYCQNALQ